MITALGIRPDARSNGVSPQVHRHIISAQWTSDGIIQGLDVTGGTGLTYNVGAGTALIQPDGQRGEAVLAYWPGGQTPAVAAGNAGLSRYDVIWMRAHDLDKGDADNQVVLGITQGTPAADPDIPINQVPNDAVRLAAMLVPAGMTQTKSCSSDGAERYAMPYGASRGRLACNVRNYEGPSNFSDGGKDYFEQDTDFYLPTDRLIELRYRATACACRHDNPKKPTEDATQMACWYVGFQIDGKDVAGGGGQFQVSRAWQQVHLNALVELKAGWHTVRTRNHRVTWGENVYFICHSDSKENYPGRTLEVWDRGVNVG